LQKGEKGKEGKTLSIHRRTGEKKSCSRISRKREEKREILASRLSIRYEGRKRKGRLSSKENPLGIPGRKKEIEVRRVPSGTEYQFTHGKERRGGTRSQRKRRGNPPGGLILQKKDFL